MSDNFKYSNILKDKTKLAAGLMQSRLHARACSHTQNQLSIYNKSNLHCHQEAICINLMPLKQFPNYPIYLSLILVVRIIYNNKIMYTIYVTSFSLIWNFSIEKLSLSSCWFVEWNILIHETVISITDIFHKYMNNYKRIATKTFLLLSLIHI